VQNAVNGVVKEQTQPLAHGWVALQEPPQVVELLAPLCNCRVETVPAHRTAAAMTTNERFWIFFFMADLLSRNAVPLFQHGCAGDGMRRAKGRPRFHWEDTEAAACARLADAATATTGDPWLCVVPQLPRRNSSSAENTNDQCGKEH
jgi:hypothetical protein